MTSPGSHAKASSFGPAVQARLMARMNELPDAIRLSRGDPDFPTPEYIVQAVQEHLSRQRYGDIMPPEGDGELREAIAERLLRVNGIEVDPVTEIVVTEGGQEAAYLAILAAVGSGDEIIVPEPNYYSYRHTTSMLGASYIPILCRADKGFAIEPEEVRAAVTNRTRALMLASPNNPSAAVIAPETVRSLVEIAVERDLLLLADDTYDQFTYDDAVHTSPASIEAAHPRTLTINTCSKTYAMTGWRIGWIAGPAPLMRRVRALKEAITGGTSSLVQVAALAALRGPQDVVDEMRSAYARRRAITLTALDSMDIPYGLPMGGQFVFLDCRKFGLPSAALAEKILERAHVLLGPGIVFGPDWDGYLRLAWLLPDDELVEGLTRLEDALRTL